MCTLTRCWRRRRQRPRAEVPCPQGCSPPSPATPLASAGAADGGAGQRTWGLTGLTSLTKAHLAAAAAQSSISSGDPRGAATRHHPRGSPAVPWASLGGTPLRAAGFLPRPPGSSRELRPGLAGPSSPNADPSAAPLTAEPGGGSHRLGLASLPCMRRAGEDRTACSRWPRPWSGGSAR